ncbi:HAD hydrolase-like protein [Lacticaseibacillus sp. GG6-2]
MITNAIWDLDGTLYDTYPGILKALHETLLSIDVKIDQDELYKIIKHGSVTETALRFARQQGLVEAEVLAEYHRREALEVMKATPYPQTAAVLKAVKDAGGNNLLMTHRDDKAWTLLARNGLDTLFLGGVTSDLHLARKPKPDAVLYLVDRFQLNPERTAMIGDRRLDVIAGQAAGVQGVYFNIDKLNDAPMADHQIEELLDIVPLLGK